MNMQAYENKLRIIFKAKVALLHKLWINRGCPMPFDAWATMHFAEDQKQDMQRFQKALADQRQAEAHRG
jgi:hypothetical protein